MKYNIIFEKLRGIKLYVKIFSDIVKFLNTSFKLKILNFLENLSKLKLLI